MHTIEQLPPAQTFEIALGSTASREQIEMSLRTILLDTDQPSLFFQALRKSDTLDRWFGELKDLIGVQQNPVYHAEGDVWNHTMMVLDQGAKLRERASDPYGFMLAALTHDFGKAVCTEEKNGVLHAYRHEILGLPIAKRCLKRLDIAPERIAYVLNLVELHMKPNTMAKANSKERSTTRLFDDAIDPDGLLCIALADDRGRITSTPGTGTEAFLNERLALYRELMARPHVTERDLADAELPSQQFPTLLEFAHKLRLAGVDKENALKQTLGHARKLHSK